MLAAWARVEASQTAGIADTCFMTIAGMPPRRGGASGDPESVYDAEVAAAAGAFLAFAAARAGLRGAEAFAFGFLRAAQYLCMRARAAAFIAGDQCGLRRPGVGPGRDRTDTPPSCASVARSAAEARSMRSRSFSRSTRTCLREVVKSGRAKRASIVLTRPRLAPPAVESRPPSPRAFERDRLEASASEPSDEQPITKVTATS